VSVETYLNIFKDGVLLQEASVYWGESGQKKKKKQLMEEIGTKRSRTEENGNTEVTVKQGPVKGV